MEDYIMPIILYNIKEKITDKIKDHFRNLIHREDGMGVVEIILITIVLITLVIVFKGQLSSLVNTILGKMSRQANTV